MAKKAEEVLTISAPRFNQVSFRIRGTSPYMQARFTAKSMQAMKTKMELGSVAKKGSKREARDFDADYHGAMHVSTDGWLGIPAGAFRNACISACRIVGFKMTLAKLSIFFESEGFDQVDGTPLIPIEGEPERTEMAVRNSTGVIDIRVRPMWRTWSANLVCRYDAEQFTAADVANLLMRVGCQVGIGEGRPDSRQSAGMGFGMFEIVNENEGSEA